MLGMIAEPREVASAREIEKLEPRLQRNSQQQAPERERAQPLKIAARLDEMLHDLACEHEFEAASVGRPAEDVGLSKSEIRTAPLGVGNRVGAQIDADIAGKIDAALGELFNEQRLAAAEIENGFRGQGANGGGGLVVEATER